MQPEIRQRVFNWQRDVAGQPVTSDPEKVNLDFAMNQIGFVNEEFFNELVPHFAEYATLSARIAKNSASIRNLESSLIEQSSIDLAKTSVEKYRYALADDIGDVAFTLIGAANSLALRPIEMLRTQFEFNIFCQVSCIHEIISDIHNVPENIFGAYWMMVDLAILLNINFDKSLLAVCDSNDTKLWTEFEVYGHLVDNKPGFTLIDARPNEVRRYRVARGSDGKLIKSPSFVPPDLSGCLNQIGSL